MEIVFPDVTLLRQVIETNLNKFVDFIEGLPNDDKELFVKGLYAIASNSEESAEILRELSSLIVYYTKDEDLLNLAELFKFVGDLMDFVDESIGLISEALFGIEEVSNGRIEA
jgi:mannitol/fructose-specific phosphotransferase system IIA component